MNKILRTFTAVLLSIALLSALIVINAYAARNTVMLYGDADESGEVDITDATLIQRHLISITTLSELQKEAADFDHDGSVTVTDVTFIQRLLVKMNIPDTYGGWFDCYSTSKLMHADYSSGKAMVGVPVHFTLKGGYSDNGTEPDVFYSPITYTIEIFRYDEDNIGSNFVDKLSNSAGIFTYTFDRVGSYMISFSICDRFDNETSYNCNYTVSETYNTDTPVITSIYTDKPRYYESLNYNSFEPKNYWQEMTLFVNAVGGSGDYTYSFSLKSEDDELLKESGKNNSFTIDKQYYPGLYEYQNIREENNQHWDDPDYIRKRYDWKTVAPYELTVTVHDSEGNETTETVQILPVKDFDIIA